MADSTSRKRRRTEEETVPSPEQTTILMEARPEAAQAPEAASAPALSADPFAGVVPDAENPTMVEYTGIGGPTRWIVDATGVETAWSRWRALHPDMAPGVFMDRLRERVPAVKVRSLGILRL